MEGTDKSTELWWHISPTFPFLADTKLHVYGVYYNPSYIKAHSHYLAAFQLRTLTEIKNFYLFGNAFAHSINARDCGKSE